MELNGTRFVMSPNGSALGLPAGEYWAVPDAELRRMQERIAELEADAQALADVRTLFAWTKLDEGHQAVIEHVNGRHYITLWPDGEVCTGGDNSDGEAALGVAAAWVREQAKVGG